MSVHNRWFGSHLEEMHCAFIIFVLCDELCGFCSWLLDMQAQFKATSECDCAFYQEVVNDHFTWQVALLTTCMTTPDDSSCTINAVSDSLPLMVCNFLRSLHNSFQVTNMDSCMTSIEDSDCTSSYGATSNYVSNSGSSLVGWVQQLSMFQ